jgi:AraC-like DNA-binding protein
MDSAGRAPLAASPRTIVTSANTLDEAGAALTEAYSDVTVGLPASQRRLRMRLTTFTAPELALGDLELTSSVVRSAHFPWFAVCLPVRGEVRVSTDRATAVVADHRAAIVAPGDPVRVEYLSPRCHMRTLLVERSAVEAELSAMLGRTVVRPLSFEPTVEHNSGDPLGRSLRLLSSEVRDPEGLATVPAMAPRLVRLVIAGVLTSCRHNYSAELTRPASALGPKPIRDAINAIDAHPELITTVADIAAAVGLSVRALDAGFRRHVGIPPMRYLRKVRLARVHRDLLDADPSRDTATSIAHRWGFVHYGRFCAEYRGVYGRSPSESLRAG